jgi:hypothetical protein
MRVSVIFIDEAFANCGYENLPRWAEPEAAWPSLSSSHKQEWAT